MNDESIFAADFKERPYWLDGIETTTADSAIPPQAVDVAIIGGGVTGTAAGWELAHGGRDTIILDAGAPGEAASSRNAGMIGRNFQHKFVDLVEAHGLDFARTVFTELHQVYRAAVDRIVGEGLDCDFIKTGRFIGALSPAHNAALFREYEARARHLNEAVEFVSADQQVEIGSTRYWGGVRILDNGALHPGRYTRAMRRRALTAGVRIFGHTPATSVVRDGDHFAVHTPRGVVRARDVLIATNGYSGPLMPYFVERLIPINAYMIATEPIGDNLARSVLPEHRTYLDNRRSMNYLRLSPDRRRLLFGGRTSRRSASLRDMAGDLYREMLFLVPQMEGTRLSHAWTGRCAATYDLFPRTGVHAGMHYALGFCFSGMAMGPYLATRAARRIMGKSDPDSVFAREPVPRAPWYARSPRLISALMRYYEWADRPATRPAA